MSHPLINHSSDLKRLVDDGYEIEVRAGHLVMRNIPYVNGQRKVRRGLLVSELSLAGDKTVRPQTHVILFAGEQPCDRNGAPLTKIQNSGARKDLGDGLIVDHAFSSKPQIGFYTDYYEKMTTYEAILSSQAAAIDPDVTARTFRTVANHDPNSPFKYIDTASGRVGIGAVNRKLALRRVYIIGLGGTGAYILDVVVKTPVEEIQLFDGKTFFQHSAFRSPGAASLGELRRRMLKVDYYKEKYSAMRDGIVANGVNIDASNVDQLRHADFVFLCIDAAEEKLAIIEKLEEFGISFVDVGMGVQLIDESLIGTLRVTTSTPAMRAHVREKQRIPLKGAGIGNEYATNIQTAELNMMNAAMAVMKWKKLYDFYVDLEHEHFSALTIDGNHLLNEDAA